MPRIDDLAFNLAYALRHLPKKLRPREEDVELMARAIARQPCMNRWRADGEALDFGDLKT